MNTRKFKHALAALSAVALLGLTACGTGSGNDSDSAEDGAEFNDQDVAFAQQMIPHHEQAIEMAEMGATRASSPQVQQLAADIEDAQGPEIETMTDWLTEWGQDVPSGDAMGMDHSEHEEMPGMMSEDTMTELETAQGPRFDQLFLTAMIEHHEGAVDMAKTEQEQGENPDAIALAEDIETAQTAEIKKMQALLGS